MDNLSIGFFFSIVSVIAFIIFIVLLKVPFGNDDLQGKFLIGSIITFVIAIIISMIFSSISIPSDYKKQQDRKDELKRTECRTRTNTYQKCSWSVIEDRCVCKLR